METIKDISIDGYRCKHCNITYKSRSGLWKHTSKCQNNIVIQSSKMFKNVQ